MNCRRETIENQREENVYDDIRDHWLNTNEQNIDRKLRFEWH